MPTPADAASELRALAAGRFDLLAVAAGVHVGGWLANPLPHGEPLIAAGFLIRAGGAEIGNGGMELAIETMNKTRENSRAGNSRWSDVG
ncbi:hypothetical protein [Jiangella anatolica]|uniref:Uncharacterized protein n=1 Tax=Jiangella anatolica TaxID=2670374 RepID=A0A2W2CY68_9ACTN|nr:hypothetical protein [Jiangella anatolica]PZF85163.1 hypothetical protein C1I92_06185 [Jiangella anatolica]